MGGWSCRFAQIRCQLGKNHYEDFDNLHPGDLPDHQQKEPWTYSCRLMQLGGFTLGWMGRRGSGVMGGSTWGWRGWDYGWLHFGLDGEERGGSWPGWLHFGLDGEERGWAGWGGEGVGSWVAPLWAGGGGIMGGSTLGWMGRKGVGHGWLHFGLDGEERGWGHAWVAPLWAGWGGEGVGSWVAPLWAGWGINNM